MISAVQHAHSPSSKHYWRKNTLIAFNMCKRYIEKHKERASFVPEDLISALLVDDRHSSHHRVDIRKHKFVDTRSAFLPIT